MGLGLEAAAYVSRTMIHEDDFNRNIFIIYIYCITLGATFLSAAIYLCLSRIVVAYGEEQARFRPRTYSIFFMVGDFLALSLQGAGGGMLQVVETQDIGLEVLLAGLSFQILSLLLFAVACADFGLCVWRSNRSPSERFADLLSSWKWTGFLWGRNLSLLYVTRADFLIDTALAVGTIGIIVRSSYRIAELQAGFHSQIFNQQILFMFLEGTVMSIVSIALTAFHPGLVFGDKWRQANFSLRGRKRL